MSILQGNFKRGPGNLLTEFVAVGVNALQSSPDGVTWTANSPPSAITYNGVCYSPQLKLWVAVGNGASHCTAQNGITWTNRTAAANANWQAVAWSPSLGLFAAVRDTGVNFSVGTSPTGQTWTLQAAPGGSWRSIRWNETLGLFIAVGAAGSNKIMTSPDGVNWTARTEASALAWQDVVFDGDGALGVALASDMSTSGAQSSPDGVNWTTRTVPRVAFSGVAYAQSVGLYVGVGTNVTSPANFYSASSPDGSTWTLGNLAAGTWNSVAWSDRLGKFVAVSSTGSNRIANSTDGATWSLSADAAGATLNYVGSASQDGTSNKRSNLTSFSGSGTDNSAGPSTSAFNVNAGTMIVVDVTREGTGDIDANGSFLTNNRGLTFVKQSSIAAFQSVPGKWYRIEKWWAYTPADLTGLTLSIQFNRTGSNNSYNTQMSIYGYSNVPKANGGNPFYSNSAANPKTASNLTGTASTMTATVDPRGIAKSVTMSSAVYRDTGLALSTQGVGMLPIHSIGTTNSSGNMNLVTEDKVSNKSLSATQAGAFVTSQAVWLVLTDVIDATP